MAIIIPQDASHDIRIAFSKVNDELRSLKKDNESLRNQISIREGDAEKVRRDLERRLDAPNSLDFNDIFRGSGAAHAIGYVVDPGATAGTDKFLREDGTFNRAGTGGYLHFDTAITNPVVDNTFFLNTANNWMTLRTPANTGLQISGGGGLITGGHMQFQDEAMTYVPAAGGTKIWHDSTLEELYMFHEDELIRRRPHDHRPTSCGFFDDFCGSGVSDPAAGNAYGFGDHHSANFAANNSGTVNIHGGLANNPGWVYLRTTGTTDGDYAILYSNRLRYPHALNRGLKRFGAGVRDPSVAAAVTNHELRVGMSTSVSGPPSNGIYFEKLTGDSNWFAVTRLDGSNAQRTNTGVVVTINAFHDFEVDTTDNASIKFYINNVLEATHTNNIYTGEMQLVVMNIFKTSGSGTANMPIDYWYYDQAPARSY